jgi:hypothetical protein
MAARVLLFCGLAAPVLFIAVDLTSGSSWRGYDFTWRSISELSAIGSPVRGSAAPLFALVNVLTIAFGVGLLRVAGGDVRLQIVAGAVIANGALALAAAVFPNRAGVTPRFLSPGVLLAAGSVLCIVIAIAAGALAFGGWLRAYSIATLGAYALLTIVGYASQMQPRIGFQERLMAYTWMVWLGLVATVLLAARTRGVDLAA